MDQTNTSQPPASNSPQAPSDKKYNVNYKLAGLILIIVILLMIVGAYLLSDEDGFGRYVTTENAETGMVEKRVNFGLGLMGVDVLPENFPVNIPVELENPAESLTREYKVNGATQYIYSYLTDKTVEEKFVEYESFMTEEGYQFGESVNILADGNGTLFGVKGDRELSVVINTVDLNQSVPADGTESDNDDKGGQSVEKKTMVKIVYMYPGYNGQ